ncbi:MAG: hypothetical protein HZC14_01120 [Candidatus Niyogibacteria bacterium]|nr:hypothetical protein [Candidatus Niyogibacteria bacterium]
MKYFPNKITILTIIAAVLVLTPILTYGYTFLAPLPGLEKTIEGSSLFSAYLSALFRFAIVIASILAVIVIIIAGLKYIGAAGNTAVVNDAKDQIYWAVLGLILALSSWLILSIINPKLLVLKLGVTSTKLIQAPNAESLFSGAYCGQFTENSACTADASCTCKCLVGQAAATTCNSLNQSDCSENAYCKWWFASNTCNPLIKVKCQYKNTTLNCQTGPKCGIFPETDTLCCMGSAVKCQPSSAITVTPQ